MQITINQLEIEEAIKNYIHGQGIGFGDNEVSVSLTAGRGANGMSATIDITPNQSKDESVYKEEKIDSIPEDNKLEESSSNVEEDTSNDSNSNTPEVSENNSLFGN